MAVANTKSDSITAFDAVVRSTVDGIKHSGILRRSVDSAEVAAADDDNSVYRILRLPSNACIKELNILNDAITSGTVYHLGVYQTAANGGAVVDADVFASTISMATARTMPLNAMFEAGLDIANWDIRLWQLLGLSSDPQRDYDICFTAATVGSAAGTLCLECVWSQ